MNIIDKTLINVKVRLQKGLHDFVTTEDGDTNFVSMLIIIAVVVVMAGAFLGIVKNSLLPTLDKTVKNFIKNPTVK
ncbi:MAG TPA: hypothetical protein DCY04_03090 [Eubacterium sp.]|jgi:hypothetical protein|nr:hypothetical protein [Eubacterium sp.]